MSAVGLVTACVETAWRARLGSVALMLSLDIAGAYDYVSHERLLAILKEKGFLEWFIGVIISFL